MHDEISYAVNQQIKAIIKEQVETPAVQEKIKAQMLEVLPGIIDRVVERDVEDGVRNAVRNLVYQQGHSSQGWIGDAVKRWMETHKERVAAKLDQHCEEALTVADFVKGAVQYQLATMMRDAADAAVYRAAKRMETRAKKAKGVKR